MAVEALKPRFQGILAWGLVAGLAWGLPGTVWKPGLPPEWSWGVLGPVTGMMMALVLLSLALVQRGGARLMTFRGLALWEALPVMLWGCLLLALWPAGWGPPGWAALALAWIAALLPGEIRWLASVLPDDWPLPAAYGSRVVRLARRRTLWGLIPQWIGYRMPLWIGSLLVLEMILGLRGLGSDWMGRVALRDRVGMSLWLAAYALLWLLARTRKGIP